MFNMIKKWSLVLRWWLVFMLINVGMVVMLSIGMVDTINEVDFTKISFLIYATFYVFSARNGVHTYKLSKKETLTKADIDEYSRKSELGWFVADALLTLGMIGTVIGFIYMLSLSLVGLTTISAATIQTSLITMSAGMSTALYTTAAGLICSLLLKIQLFDLSQYLDKMSKKDELK